MAVKEVAINHLNHEKGIFAIFFRIHSGLVFIYAQINSRNRLIWSHFSWSDYLNLCCYLRGSLCLTGERDGSVIMAHPASG